MSDNDTYQDMNYQSDDSSTPQKKPRKKKAQREYEWQHHLTLENAQEDEQWLIDQNIWSSTQTYHSGNGKRVIYRCKKIPSRAKTCAAAPFLLYDIKSNRVNIFINKEAHNHDEILANSKTRGINEETQTAILDLVDSSIRAPKHIRERLGRLAANNPDIKVPTEKQIYNFLQYRKSTFLVFDLNLALFRFFDNLLFF